MKKVTVLTEQKKKQELLLSLRDVGLMHITDIVDKSPAVESLEKDLSSLNRVQQALSERADKKAEGDSKLRGAAFDSVHASLVSALDEKDRLTERSLQLRNEKERIAQFGDFDPEEVKALKAEGIDLRLYTLDKKELVKLQADQDVKYLSVKTSGKTPAVALVSGEIPAGVSATEFPLPEQSLSAIDVELAANDKRQAELEAKLKEGAVYLPSYKKRIAVENEKITFERVNATVEGDDIIYLTGYIPETGEETFREYAAKNSLAYLLDDPSEEDNPPTLIRYNKVTKLIAPVFNLLGTTPGYREMDVSSYFLVFFTLFFAMIIGDAGYGLIFVLLAVLLHVKSKKLSDLNMLVYVLGVATVIWGTLTGTWFGSKAILEKLPFLQKLVIPQIANYPELFGLTTADSQNGQMSFCFFLGVLQLGLARCISITNKLKARDLSWLGEVGWLIDSIVMYFLALSLVVGGSVSMSLVVGCVVVGFVLVTVFGHQGPNISFKKGLTAGLADFFTTFLDTISCFSDTMSYIRLFAVGMATLAIAQSFNGMAGGMMHGIMAVFGVLVILIGHALNLVMGLLSVLVHDVRLNLLEFSGAIGIEWAGYDYNPFRRTVIE